MQPFQRHKKDEFLSYALPLPEGRAGTAWEPAKPEISVLVPTPIMALELTQPLTEISTSDLPGDKGRPTLKADLTAICELSVWRKYGSLDVSQQYGSPWPVTGIALPLPPSNCSVSHYPSPHLFLFCLSVSSSVFLSSAGFERLKRILMKVDENCINVAQNMDHCEHRN
jgi:hypothetical protein